MAYRTYRINVSNVGLASSAGLCIVTTFLPWVVVYGSTANLYNLNSDGYFSGTPETFLITSGVILVVAVLNMLLYNLGTRVLAGLMGILGAVVVVGYAATIYTSASQAVSSNGSGSIGYGNYLAVASGLVILAFSILVLLSGKYGLVMASGKVLASGKSGKNDISIGETMSAAQAITKYAELRKQGILTDAEFSAKKRELLGM